jgi:hypothetical protein
MPSAHTCVRGLPLCMRGMRVRAHLLAVRLHAVAQAIQALCGRFAVRARERLQAGVDLDAGFDALRRKHIHKRHPRSAALEQGLLKHDCACMHPMHVTGPAHAAVGACRGVWVQEWLEVV